MTIMTKERVYRLYKKRIGKVRENAVICCHLVIFQIRPALAGRGDNPAHRKNGRLCAKGALAVLRDKTTSSELTNNRNPARKAAYAPAAFWRLLLI